MLICNQMLAYKRYNCWLNLCLIVEAYYSFEI